MSFRRQHIRNNRATIEAGTPLIAEYVYDTDLKTIRAGDGATLGGLLLKLWGKAYTVSPSQITSNQNNYNPTDLSIGEALILDLDADRTMTGLAGGATNREVTLYNKSAFRLTLAHESASSTAGNRFTLPGAVDVVVRPYQSLRLLYSAATSRWIVIGAGAGWLGVTDLAENVSLSGDITPAQITSNQNDYSPTGLSLASRLRLNTDASRNVTGIAGGADGRILILVNVGSNTLVLKNADAASTAANRFDFGADCSLSGKQVAVIQYDATDSRWKMLANTAGAAVADAAVTAVKLATSAMAAGVAMINGTIAVTRAGNAETYAVKTLAGADPSAADPVRFIFDDGAGAYTVIDAVAALSVTVSSGSSLGQANAAPFRVWGVIVNDAGTLRLAVGCMSEPTGQIYPLNEDVPFSSTAEGGAGAADSAGVLYSGTAFTSKYGRVLFHADYEAGLATAGTWNTAPDRVVLHGPGKKKPGEVVKTARAPATTTVPAALTATSYGDVDATSFAVTITPSSKINGVAVKMHSTVTNTVTKSGSKIARSSGTDITLGAPQTAPESLTTSIHLEGFDLPGVVVAQKYVLRGINSAGSQSATYGNGPTITGGGGNTFIATAEEIMR